MSQEWKWYRHKADAGVRYKARPMPDGEAFAIRRDGEGEIGYVPAWMFDSPQAIYELEEDER